MALQIEEPYRTDGEIEEVEEEEEPEDWDDWRDGEGDDEDSELGFLCLFCNFKFNSCSSLFQHCISTHHFDFHRIRKDLGLDFYGSFKLINYVRSKVAENGCWSCGQTIQSKQDLKNHWHEVTNFKDIKILWGDDRYLKPFMQDDSLLYSFSEFEDSEDDSYTFLDKEGIMRDLMHVEDICLDEDDDARKMALNNKIHDLDNGNTKDIASFFNGFLNKGCFSEKEELKGEDLRSCVSSTTTDADANVRQMKPYFSNPVAKDIKNVNENYFGAYSSFSIHREMLGDKVRMDTYGKAILKNTSLLNGAVVMDVGCGTGILSLFSAQAGASRVIAVEASKKMAAVATQIAKDNGLLCSNTQLGGPRFKNGVIEVVLGMVEEIDEVVQIEPHSVDVLLSEWMGYCLLYESMLSSVLFARDRWLKPGGAILPDTATIFVAGFGKGGTSLIFWESVCGFDMSCVGKELVEDAAQIPIIDVVNEHDIVTDPSSLQTFDLVTMKPDEVDFTASATLEPKLNSQSKICQCYGVVLWFETGFTSRFCREMPTVLSTSPYTPKTHWSQTILTFREPISMADGKADADSVGLIGTDACPAVKINLRISIVRSIEHRSIDISLETTGISIDGRKHSWPAQMFALR